MKAPALIVRTPLLAGLLSGFLAWGGVACAQEAVAVLSSDLGPYAEAYRGFEEGYGRPVPKLGVAGSESEIPRSARVVVAFGGKAALRELPAGVAVISCLAPGVRLEGEGRGRVVVNVHMTPRAEVILARVKEIQPGLGRLGVIWSSEEMEEEVSGLRRASSGQGVEVLSERVSGGGDLPERLRSLLGRGVGGVWLAPDPLLINARNLLVLKEFSWSNDIPLYVPTEGLVEKGALASVSCSFGEMGRVAGRAARGVLSGRTEQEVIHPEEVEVVVNLTAAGSVGVSVSPEVIARAKRVLR